MRPPRPWRTNPPQTTIPLHLWRCRSGKTHLLTAIGNQILAANGNARICLYTSEKFMNEMINCIRYKKMEEFRTNSKYGRSPYRRHPVHGRKEANRKNFSTFNALHESHKQIVVTSASFPKIWQGWKNVSAPFRNGSDSDIHRRTSKPKCHLRENPYGRDSSSGRCGPLPRFELTSNVRELEGMLIRLGAYAS